MLAASLRVGKKPAPGGAKCKPERGRGPARADPEAMAEAAGKVYSGFGHSPHRLISDRVRDAQAATDRQLRLRLAPVQYSCNPEHKLFV